VIAVSAPCHHDELLAVLGEADFAAGLPVEPPHETIGWHVPSLVEYA
jgi:hypothetical protein